MTGMKSFFSALVLALAVPASASVSDSPYNHTLYYTSPATIWEETLPLGNGRLGMMPDGGIAHERVVLNEISVWSGSEFDYGNPDASRSLPEIRQLLFEGKNLEAQELMYSSFVPKLEDTDGRYGSYQVLGFLDIAQRYADADTADVSNYRRELLLNDAVASTSFRLDGVDYRREYFTSRNLDVMLVHFTASRAGALTFSARLNRPERALITADGTTLYMDGELASGSPSVEGVRFHTAMRVLATDGHVAVSEDTGITLSGGTEAWIVVSAATSYSAEGTDFAGEQYVPFADNLLNEAVKQLAQNADAVRTSHIAAHRELYDRVSLAMPASPDDALPTNVRLLRFASGAHAPSMAVLYYNYGRYVLICSTRPGSLPPNLQGLWANDVQTPWNGDYHANINIQMNHWPLEQAGLPELYQPLTTLIERLVPSGRETARTFYGKNAQGWVLHMMTNVWNYTAPGSHPSWGATNTGGAWLCAHLWENYQYTQDRDYLRRVYPIMKGAAEFFHSTTVREPQHGWLVTAPTSSPENSFYLPDDTTHTPVSVCMGPTMDVQLLRELYTNVIEATRLLDCDEAFALTLERDLADFPPMQISKEGYLQEWLEDYKEVDVHHRHVSHLYGLHPSNQISPTRTPDLAEACRVTLNRRGDGGTGWSRAWKVNFWARLGDGNRAWQLFCNLLNPAIDPLTGSRGGSGTYPNLFCSHPPFQLDGNFGGAAGIGEMLLQSHEGFIQLLPALPDDWRSGSFRGMRVRGGAAVDLDWEDGHATRAVIHSLTGSAMVLKMPEGATQAELTKDGKTTLVSTSMIEVKLQKGESCTIAFR